MPWAITKYQSSDKKEHNSIEEAEAHEMDLIGEEIDDILKGACNGRFTRTDVYNVFVALFPSHKEALRLRDFFNKTLTNSEYGEYEE